MMDNNACLQIEELDVEQDLTAFPRSRYKQNIKFNFPVVTITKDRIVFNAAASDYLREVGRLAIFTSKDYLIFRPTQEKTGYKVFPINKKDNCTACAIGIPVALKYGGLQRGYYKLYKYKDGFAVKRKEPSFNN